MKKSLFLVSMLYVFCVLFVLVGDCKTVEAHNNTTSSENSVSNNRPDNPDMINRDAVVYCAGNGSWATIIGDNNAIGEGVNVTNLTSREIRVKAFSQDGEPRGTKVIPAGETGWFGFWLWDGTYYFKAQFTDDLDGFISIHMQSDWIVW